MQCSKSIHMGNEIKKELSCLYISKGDTVYYIHTLNSGIDVGPTFINFGFFPDPTALLEST